MEKTPIDFSVPESVTGHPFLPLLLMSLKAILSDSSIDYAADQSTVHGKKGLRSQVSELCSFGGEHFLHLLYGISTSSIEQLSLQRMLLDVRSSQTRKEIGYSIKLILLSSMACPVS